MWNYNLGKRFSAIAQKHSQNVALKFLERDYTYQELDSRSNQIAHFLIQNNVKHKDVVTLTSKKTFDTYATIVACWKIGAAHSFVDRHSPPERLEKILNTCNSKLIVCDSELKKQIYSHIHIPTVELENYSQSLPANTSSVNQDHICGNTIAYVMFTSGSTGTPKGVAITHEQVINFAHWGEDQYQITPNDTLANMNSLFFDNSIFDVMISLLHGASLVPISREDIKNPKATLQHLENKKTTTWFSVPSLLIYFLNLGAFQKSSLMGLSRFIFGGEGFPKNKLKELYELFGDRVKLHNVYGPTECTCICSSYLISDQDFSTEEMQTLAPLGHLSKNFEYLVLNEKHEPTPVGEIGELYLGGPNVSPGYYQDTLRTQEKFIQNPTHQKHRDIFYRTGDLVKVQPQTQYLYFQGRIDDQIKFMGYRIELSEIESAISTIPDVREVAVTYGMKDTHPEITCFLSTRVDKSEIKNKLKNTLPSYMIPRKFIYLDILPKNANGKVNRKKLAEEYYDPK